MRKAFYLAFHSSRCCAMDKLMIQKGWEDQLGRESMRRDRADWFRRNGQLARYWT
jgi:hypothetical protein